MTTTTVKKRRRNAKAIIQVRVDAKIKDKADKLFKRHGMTTGDGMRLLINQAIDNDALPLDPRSGHIPNAETEEAMRDVEEGRTYPVSLEELKKRLFGNK